MPSPVRKRILITGSHGRVGRDLVKILGREYEVIELTNSDIWSEKSFMQIEALIHLAARTPSKEKEISQKDYFTVNVELTKIALAYATKHKIKTTIIPTSWSWAFKVGPYQYSKLLQEKIACEYQHRGLRIILPELPEVIHSGYEGVLTTLVNKIKNNQITTVDRVLITLLTTEDFATICKQYIEGNDLLAESLYQKMIKTIDLYQEVKGIISREAPDRLEFLREGPVKIRKPFPNDDGTICFAEPEFS